MMRGIVRLGTFCCDKVSRNNLVASDQNCWAYDTAVSAFFCRWKALGPTSPRGFLGFNFVNMLPVRHSDEVEYVRGQSD